MIGQQGKDGKSEPLLPEELLEFGISHCKDHSFLVWINYISCNLDFMIES